MLTPQPEDLEEETDEDEEPRTMGVYLDYMKDVNLLHRETLDTLHQEVMERDLNQ